MRWKIDQDYLAKLSESEREWLAKFNDAHYGGDFRRSDPAEWDQTQRRAAWSEQRAAKRDAYTLVSLSAAGVEELTEYSAVVAPAEVEFAARPPEAQARRLEDLVARAARAAKRRRAARTKSPAAKKPAASARRRKRKAARKGIN